jgi:multidrug efflux pump
VLFSLILAVGMLVDDAIIVTEYAERRMTEGMHRPERSRSRGACSDRSSWRRDPYRRVLAAAVLARHRRRVHGLPAAHADCTLSASILYALFFAPTLGSIFGKATVEERQARRALHDGCQEGGPASAHRRSASSIAADGRGSSLAYGKYNNGVEFFPDVEPEYGLRLCSCARQPVARRAGRRGQAPSRTGSC